MINIKYYSRQKSNFATNQSIKINKKLENQNSINNI